MGLVPYKIRAFGVTDLTITILYPTNTPVDTFRRIVEGHQRSTKQGSLPFVSFGRGGAICGSPS